MGTDRTFAVAAKTATPEISRAATGFKPSCTERHPVRVQDRDTLVRPVDQVGIRFGANLLEALARLAESRRMDQVAPATAGQVTRGGRARFLTSSRRFMVGASRWGGRKTGPNPTDRSRPGSKHHILVDANGIPVSAILTGANHTDLTQLLPLVAAIPPIRGVRGRPLLKPKVIFADRGYDSEPHRQGLRERGIKSVFARRRTEHGSGLGKFRWVVERTHAWLHNFRRLRIRFERRADIHEAFLKLGCSLVCWNIFRRAEPPF
ncbi:transposase (plasmid) [Pandoraea oxalativorans]|uniref:Transposase n=1 Tax=Pandoraea oxalativorans TaxID=573737 RepID=A0A0G3IF82_9BURK|nr:transposase [Pandoraea oxalativorans]